MAKRWTIQQVAQYQKEEAQHKKREKWLLGGAGVLAVAAGVLEYLKRKRKQ